MCDLAWSDCSLSAQMMYKPTHQTSIVFFGTTGELLYIDKVKSGLLVVLRLEYCQCALARALPVKPHEFFHSTCDLGGGQGRLYALD